MMCGSIDTTDVWSMSQQTVSKDHREGPTWSRNTVHVSKLALPLRILDLGKLGSVHLDALSC